MEIYEKLNSEASDTISVSFLFLDGNKETVEVDPSDTISTTKSGVFSDEKYRDKLIRLVYCGKLLEDDKTLNDYREDYTEIEDNAFIHVSLQENRIEEVQVDNEELEDMEEEDPNVIEEHEGTGVDFLIGVILGFFFHVIMLICVLSI